MRAFICKYSGAGLVAALSLSLSGLALGADTAGACRTSDPMRTSMIAKADQGADALRRYAFITRAIHQLDATEVANSLDAWRAEAGCVKKTAVQGSPEAPVATAASADAGRG